MGICTQEINPTVLDCRYFDAYALHAEGLMEARRVQHFELEYFIKSDGGIWVDGRFLPFRAGELSIRRPGQMVQGVAPYSSMLLAVNLVGRESTTGGGIIRKSGKASRWIMKTPCWISCRTGWFCKSLR